MLAKKVVLLKRRTATARIVLSRSDQDENTAIGTTIGTLSVVNGTGSYTFTETADPDTAFTLTVNAVKNGVVFDYETKSAYSVSFNADNGAGSSINGAFSIQVNDVTASLVNTVAPVLSGTEQQGATSTLGDGTWTGGPTSFTYKRFRAITSGGEIVTSGGLFTGNEIVGATSANYDYVAGDVGERIYGEVTAHKAEATSVMAQSNATGVITAPAWTPASLGAALEGWFKADTGVYNDAGTTPATDGQTVQQWNDQSGNGVTLSQATSGQRPTYRATGFNSRKGIQFVAANSQFLASGLTAFALGGTTFSAYVVMFFTSSTGSNGRIVTFRGNGQSDDFGNTASGIPLLTPNPSSFGGFRSGVGSGTFAASVDTNYRVGGEFDGSFHTIYRNNVAGTPAAVAGTFGLTGEVGVGGYTGSSTYLGGTIAEVVLTSTVLSSGDRTSLDDYFKAKWGL